MAITMNVGVMNVVLEDRLSAYISTTYWLIVSGRALHNQVRAQKWDDGREQEKLITM